MAKKGKGGGNGGKEPYWRRIFSTSAPEKPDSSKYGFGDSDEDVVFYEYGDEIYDTEDEVMNSALKQEKTVMTCGYLKEKMRGLGVEAFRKADVLDGDGEPLYARVMRCDFVDRGAIDQLLSPPLDGDPDAKKVLSFIKRANKSLSNRLNDSLKENPDGTKESLENALWEHLEDELPHNDIWVEKGFEIGVLCPEFDRLFMECGKKDVSDAKKEKCKKLLSDVRFKCSVETESGKRIIL